MRRVRQLQKTTSGLQAAFSIRSSKETNQKMHAVLLSVGRIRLRIIHAYIHNKRQRQKQDLKYNNILDKSELC